jgi:hypothetical protein
MSTDNGFANVFGSYRGSASLRARLQLQCLEHLIAIASRLHCQCICNDGETFLSPGYSPSIKTATSIELTVDTNNYEDIELVRALAAARESGLKITQWGGGGGDPFADYLISLSD